MLQQPQASGSAAQTKPGQDVVAEPQESPQHAAAPAAKNLASPPPPPPPPTDVAAGPSNNADNEPESPHHNLPPPPRPEVVSLPASPYDLAAQPDHDVIQKPKSSQDAATPGQNPGPSSRPPPSGSPSELEPSNRDVRKERNDPDVAAPPDPDDVAPKPPADPANAANNPVPRGPEPEAASAPAPGPTRDIAAETYFSECVNNPQEAEFCIDYPARVYHLKPQKPGRGCRSCTSSSGLSPHHHQHTAGDDDDDDNNDINNLVKSTVYWQSTFLWQPVLLPTTSSSGRDPQQQQLLLLLRRRPMTDIDRMNTTHFLWFRPSSTSSEPQDHSLCLDDDDDDGNDDDNNNNDNDNNYVPALGFRPWVDVLFLDTDFLETYLYHSSPADHADPLLGSATFFSFLPRPTWERAKVKIVALSAEPLCKATFVPDENLPDLAVYNDDGGDGDERSSSWNHRLDALDSDNIRRRVRREQYEALDLRVRRRAIARLLVSVFPCLQHIYLVAMASVPHSSPASKTTPGEFSKWGRLQDAILAEHRQILREKTPKSSYFQQNHPNALLYRRALQWNLVIPKGGDDASPTSSSQLSSLPQIFEKDIMRARRERLAAQEWQEEKERERANPDLQKTRYERHRLTPFSRAWPERREGEKEEVVEKRDVKAEPMIMMYFADKFQQARKAGWEPGETMDVEHLFGRPSR